MNCPRADPKRHVYTFSRQLSLPKVEFCAGKGNFLRRGSREIPKGQTQIEWGDGVFVFRCCRLSRVITRTHNIDSRASPPTWRHTLLYFSRSALSFFLPPCLFPRGNATTSTKTRCRPETLFSSPSRCWRLVTSPASYPPRRFVPYPSPRVSTVVRPTLYVERVPPLRIILL